MRTQSLSISKLVETALKLQQSGRVQESIALYRQALLLEPKNAQALQLLGVGLSQTGDHAGAIRHLRDASRLAPRSCVITSNLGFALLAADRLQEAQDAFKRAMAADPNYEHANLGYARALARSGQVDKAKEALKSLIERSPWSAQILIEYGNLLLNLRQAREAVEAFERATEIDRNNELAHFGLGNALCAARQFEAAEAVFGEYLKRFPTSVRVMKGLVECYRASWQAMKAKDVAEKALSLAPNDPNLLLLLSRCLIEIGDNQRAEHVLRTMISKGYLLTEALSSLAKIHKFSSTDPEIQIVNSRLGQEYLADSERVTLLFVRSKIEDDTGNAGNAVNAATMARSLVRVPNRIDEYTHYIRSTLARFDAPFFESRREIGDPSEQPVFVLGMPRSGTSLTEQIIASHSDADGAGELTTVHGMARKLGFERLAFTEFDKNTRAMGRDAVHEFVDHYHHVLRLGRKPNAVRITDKMPHNFQNIWLIALLFPNARIVHCIRNPADVCMSIFLHDFTDTHWYARDLATLGKYYRLYEEQVAHWKSVCGLKWYDSIYEDLVADPEPNIRKMIDFLDLPWDDKCLAHTETQRSVHTFSQFQVRQPIYTSSVERWRKYADHIGPLLRELGIDPGAATKR